jgi:hypothetical protein
MEAAGPGRIILLEEGKTYAPPLPIENLRPIEQAAGDWDVAPAMRFDWDEQKFFLDRTLEVRRVKDTPRPKQGEIRYYAPVLKTNQPCKNGDWYFTGYDVTEEKTSGPTITTEQNPVNASLGGKIGVSAGTTVTMTTTRFFLEKQFTRLAYRCQNGEFKLRFRQKCSKPGMALTSLVGSIKIGSGTSWIDGATICNPPATGAR